MKRRVRQQSSVAIFLALFAPAGIDAPAVANDEHDRASHTSRTVSMNKRIDKRFFQEVMRG